MPAFASWDAFSSFAHIVRTKSRFGHNPKLLLFLEAIRASSQERLITLRKGHPLWRAQTGHDWGKELVSEGESEDEDVEVDVEVPMALTE